MKLSLMVWAVCLTTGMASAQKSIIIELPDTVENVFARSYPNAMETIWTRFAEDSTYHARFKVDNVRKLVTYKETGALILTRTDFDRIDLPGLVVTRIAKEFPGYRIDKAETVEGRGQKMFFEVWLRKRRTKVQARISMEGMLLTNEDKK